MYSFFLACFIVFLLLSSTIIVSNDGHKSVTRSHARPLGMWVNAFSYQNCKVFFSWIHSLCFDEYGFQILKLFFYHEKRYSIPYKWVTLCHSFENIVNDFKKLSRLHTTVLQQRGGGFWRQQNSFVGAIFFLQHWLRSAATPIAGGGFDNILPYGVQSA